MSLSERLISGRGKVSKDVVLEVCEKVKKYFDDQPNVISINIDEDGVVVVGDIHGQGDDLVYILKNTPKQTTYLFLGDYIDRGLESLRVVMLIFSLILEPNVNVFCLRGNHETEAVASAYGFLEEAKNVYGDEDGVEVFKVILDVCSRMPLAAVVGTGIDRYFCVHAGLSRLLKIEDIQKIERKKVDLIDNSEILEKYYERDPIPIVDMLWSDPNPGISGFHQSTRGCGYLYGEDVTKKFCEENKIRMIIRSHQLVAEGYRFLHDQKTLTLFSASNYAYKCNNMGAYAVISSTKGMKLKTYRETLSMLDYEKELCMSEKKVEEMGNLERTFKKKQLDKMSFLQQIRERRMQKLKKQKEEEGGN